MPRAILFDLDGTLVNREDAAQEWLRFHFAQLPAPIGSFETLLARFHALDARGKGSKLDTFTVLIEEWNFPFSPAALWADYKSGVARFCTLFPDALPVLRELRARNFPLGLVTNGTVECQASKIAALGLDQLVDLIVISEAIGARKPERAFFECAAQRLQLPPGEILVVGDSLDADVEGALNAGMTAIWLVREAVPAPRPDILSVASLSQLPAIIARG